MGEDLADDPKHMARVEKVAMWLSQQASSQGWTWRESLNVILGLAAVFVRDDQWPVTVERLRALADDIERACKLDMKSKEN